jgi:cardiolipin synthase
VNSRPDAAAASTGRVDRPDDHLRFPLESLLGVPFIEGNRITVLRNGCRIFPAMLDAIGAATHFIEFLTFIYWKGTMARRFADALGERARAGVKVRVLLDAFGARPMPQELVRRMAAAGCDVRWYRPLWPPNPWRLNHRTHRKLLVVDGRVAFTGGVGIAEEWEGDARDPSEWRDSHFKIEGPAVRPLRAAFVGNWAEVDGRASLPNGAAGPLAEVGDAEVQVLRSTSSLGWNDVAILLDAVLRSAERSIRITTPYFAPDEPSVRRFLDARERGVEVEVLIPGPYTDKRISELASQEEFERLVEGGVQIWRYQPTMIHAKIITLDGCAAVVGSPNFNHRSMCKDEEVALTVLDAAFTDELDAQMDDDIAQSRPLDLREIRRRSWPRRALGWALRPIRQNF